MPTCECVDRGCVSATHRKPVTWELGGLEVQGTAHRDCDAESDIRLYRLDDVNAVPIHFCDECADDALASGVFDHYDTPEDAGEEV